MFSGIAFTSCNAADPPWEANVLESPELDLQTDTLLTFLLSAERNGSLDIYATSDVGHVSVRIAEFSPSNGSIETVPVGLYNVTNEYGNVTDDNVTNTTNNVTLTFNTSSPTFSGTRLNPFTTQSVCVPRGSYKIAFVASATNVDDNQDLALKDVVLTGEPCTAETSPGNKPPIFSE